MTETEPCAECKWRTKAEEEAQQQAKSDPSQKARYVYDLEVAFRERGKARARIIKFHIESDESLKTWQLLETARKEAKGKGYDPVHESVERFRIVNAEWLDWGP